MRRCRHEAVIVVVQFHGQRVRSRWQTRQVRERTRAGAGERPVDQDVDMACAGDPRSGVVRGIEGEARDGVGESDSLGAHTQGSPGVLDDDGRLACGDRDVVPDLRVEGRTVRAHELGADLRVARGEGREGRVRLARLPDEEVVHVEPDPAMVRRDTRQGAGVQHKIGDGQLDPRAFDAEGRPVERIDDLHGPRGRSRGRAAGGEQRRRQEDREQYQS